MWYPFWPKSKLSDFGQKPWTIIRGFYRNRGDFLQSFYSTVEGATKLKFASFCPLEMPFHVVSFLAKVKTFSFGQKPWTIIRGFYRNRGDFLQSFYSTVEGATKLKFASFCPLEMPFHMVAFLAIVKFFRFWQLASACRTDIFLYLRMHNVIIILIAYAPLPPPPSPLPRRLSLCVGRRLRPPSAQVRGPYRFRKLAHVPSRPITGLHRVR